MMILQLTLSYIFLMFHSTAPQEVEGLEGAWKGEEGVYIFADGYYSYASFSDEEFRGTHGGEYNVTNNKLSRIIEFNTFDSSSVGNSLADDFTIRGDELIIDDKKFKKIDDGTPGDLHGAWLISGRMQENGEISERRPVGPRKTMKILSGKRFQWIAYNTETKEFMGTGGGTYTTEDGRYTENIDFFSRDQSRVGASLPFEYELKEGNWHHKGNSSKGHPIYEVWTKRSNL